MTITGTGVTPGEITVAVGGRVLFINNDVIPHDIAGGPDPSRPASAQTPSQYSIPRLFSAAAPLEFLTRRASLVRLASRT